MPVDIKLKEKRKRWLLIMCLKKVETIKLIPMANFRLCECMCIDLGIKVYLWGKLAIDWEERERDFIYEREEIRREAFF